ncbi:hypothetical protein ACRQ5Q_41480 (plasmid) [Bradyrhizobium sp. PMVTL-01]|uniref:hypothetical protein n=1 Tax=Bradyrhizobium sp. PMVTL-01 TaxID=3434999 RepID=UPI003F710956
MTASEISQPTERRIVQSEQALVVTAANLNERSVLQLLQPRLQVGQGKFRTHGHILRVSLRAVHDQLTWTGTVRSLFPDKPAPIPPKQAAVTFCIDDFKDGPIVKRRQPNVAGMNRKHTAIPAHGGDVDFVQASSGTAVSRLIAAAKIVEMES